MKMFGKQSHQMTGFNKPKTTQKVKLIINYDLKERLTLTFNSSRFGGIHGFVQT